MLSIADSLFHLSDIRADSSLFSSETIDRLTNAEALYFYKDLGVNTVILARDARLSGSDILDTKCNILLSLGFDVILYQNPISTPFFYFACLNYIDAAGIMISASHNPKNYNGEKLIGPNLIPISSNYEKTGSLDKIRNYFESGCKIENPARKGKVIIKDLKDSYIEFAKSYIDNEGSYFKGSILFDFLSGSASVELLPYLTTFSSFSFKNFVPNGSFPQGDPNPIKRKITSFDEDYLIMFDGDGDRMDVISKDLKQIPPSAIFTLILPYISKKKGTVCLDPKASPLIIKYLNSNGYKTLTVPNGHSQIKRIMNDDKSIIAAVEESGHYYININYNGNIYATENIAIVLLALLKALENDSEKLSFLISLTNSYFREREWTYSFEDNEVRKAKLREITEIFLSLGYSKKDTLYDGTPLGSVILTKDTDNWVQVTLRASETELFIARFEVLAKAQEESKKVKALIMDVLSK